MADSKKKSANSASKSKLNDNRKKGKNSDSKWGSIVAHPVDTKKIQWADKY